MDLIEIGTQLLKDRLGLELDSQTVQNAISSLLGDGTGGIDITGLATKMAGSGDLTAMLGTFLGDGANANLSADAIKDLFGEGQLSEFAGRLGIDSNEAAAGLSDVLPQLLDKASSGGNLLDQFTGSGAGGLLKGLLG